MYEDLKIGKYFVWLLGLATLVFTFFHGLSYGVPSAICFTLVASATLWLTYQVCIKPAASREIERILIVPFSMGVFIILAMPENFSNRYYKVKPRPKPIKWNVDHADVKRTKASIRFKSKIITDPRYTDVSVRYLPGGGSIKVTGRFQSVKDVLDLCLLQQSTQHLTDITDVQWQITVIDPQKEIFADSNHELLQILRR